MFSQNKWPKWRQGSVACMRWALGIIPNNNDLLGLHCSSIINNDDKYKQMISKQLVLSTFNRRKLRVKSTLIANFSIAICRHPPILKFAYGYADDSPSAHATHAPLFIYIFLLIFEFSWNPSKHLVHPLYFVHAYL